MNFAISNLRERPEFFLTVADRVWDFTWKSKGVSLADVSAGLRELISNETFPFVIVAHDGARYVGSTLGIASDMDERPEYTPWVAAVWVEPQYRGQNIGRSLVSCAAGNLLQAFQRVYLCARRAARFLCATGLGTDRARRRGKAANGLCQRIGSHREGIVSIC
jgi:GNAT superfamily N-acetyltransferase